MNCTIIAPINRNLKKTGCNRIRSWCLLQQGNIMLLADLQGICVPQAGLDFADMGAADEQHAKTGLTDTAADGQGQFVCQQHLVEG